MDKELLFGELFSNSEEKLVRFDREYISTFEKGFMFRMNGKGFSDQAAVPDETHKAAIKQVTDYMDIKFNKRYKEVEYIGSEGDIKIVLYTKQ